MNFLKWTEEAKIAIKTKVKVNQTFELKSLFEGCKWETLSKGERISFGKYFANEVREGNIESVIAIGRDRNNHSKYIKITVEDFKK